MLLMVSSLEIDLEDAEAYLGRFLRFRMFRNHRGFKATSPIELLSSMV